MKHIISIISLVLLLGCQDSSVPVVGYTLDGAISGLQGKVYLARFEGNKPYRIDSVHVVNGIFSFSGDCEIPVFVELENERGPLVRFFLENGHLCIQGDASRPRSIQVLGSATQDVYQSFVSHMDSLEHRLLSCERESATADSLRDEILHYEWDFVHHHRESVASALILYWSLFMEASADSLREALEEMSPMVRQSVYAQLLGKMIESLDRTAVGKHFTDISLPDTTGQSISLSGMIGTGKYVLLDFWASWCSPCSTENDHLRVLYERYHLKGFDIYGVSLDASQQAWTDYIRRGGFPWPQVSSLGYWDTPAAVQYGIRVLPSNVLIGPDGTILARNLPVDSLQSRLSTYFYIHPRGEKLSGSLMSLGDTVSRE